VSELSARMAASSTWWENYLRERNAAAEKRRSRESYLRFLIAIAASVFILCWELAK
jgi:hypothetical protein